MSDYHGTAPEGRRIEYHEPICCEACEHPWDRHTSGGMCTGAPPDGSECYCVLFPPDPAAPATEKDGGGE